MNWTPSDVAAMIDHSLLRPELTPADIADGCEISRKYRVAAVCCAPCDVALCKRLLAGSEVRIAAVVGFPHGYSTTRLKVLEAEQAIADGAHEIDMVMAIGRLRGGEVDYIRQDIKAVVDVAHGHGVLVKVILENAYLTDEQKVTACKLAEAAGADFVKTSTGFTPTGATIEDVKLMRRSVSDRVQVKCAHGVRTLQALLDMIDAGVTRTGATATAAILDEFQRAHPS